VNQIKKEADPKGFDAATLKWVDLIETGIVDPAMVVRSAVQNAASISGLLITTETMVADKPEEEKAPPMPGGGGGGMPGGMPGGMGGMGGM